MGVEKCEVLPSLNQRDYFEWIIEELKNGEDVELFLIWDQSTGDKKPGHAVELVGGGDIPVAKGSIPTLMFLHDAIQGDETLLELGQRIA